MSAPSTTGSPTFDFEGIETFESLDVAAAEQAAAEQVQDGGGQGQWTTIYPGVEPFVREVFAPTFVRRTTATFRWCPQWWRHPEAVMRMEALWRTWEVLRRDPQAGMAIWLREHADHHLPILTGSAGPFAECEPREHFDSDPDELPTAPAPEHWWLSQDQEGVEEGQPAAEQRDEDQPEQARPTTGHDEVDESRQVEVDQDQHIPTSSTDRSPDHHSMEA